MGRRCTADSANGRGVSPEITLGIRGCQRRLTEHVDAEWRHAGIRAFPIQPGTITTQMARETLADPAAEKWAAPLVGLLRSVTQADSDQAEALLQQRVAEMASGRWDALAGRYLDVAWDFEALQRETASRP